jgi:glycosyltransferase involved in cell wall biosynthesis
MKALVLAPQPFFSPRGTPFSVYYRTRTMAQLGEEIHLLTYGQGHDVQLGDVRVFRTPRLRMLGRIPTGPSFRKIVHDGFLFLYAVLLLTRHRYDYVHAHEESVFIASMLKPFFRFKILYDMHSSLPEQLANFQYTRSRLLNAFFRWAEGGALKKSEAVIVVCPALLDYARSRVEEKHKIVLIENSQCDPVEFVDVPSYIEPNESIETASNLAADGHELIVYTGTFEPYQGIQLLLESFAELGEDFPETVLLLVGGSPRQVHHYQRMAEQLGVSDRCLLTGTVPHSVAVSFSDLATILVSPRLTGKNTPMKIYSQLASGIPLVATRIESHTQVLNDDVAILVAPNATDLASGLRRALQAPNEARRIAVNARAHYEQNYSHAAYVGGTEKALALLR